MADPTSDDRELDAIKRTAQLLQLQLTQLQHRIDSLALDRDAKQSKPFDSSNVVPPPIIHEPPAPLSQLTRKPHDEEHAPGAGHHPRLEPISLAARHQSADDREAQIGGTWFNRIGAILLLLGVAFFVKYSFEQGWLSPPVRVMLGGATGLALLAVGGLFAWRGLRDFAVGVLAAGIAVLYASTYAAQSLYGLIGTQTAFWLYVVVTALGVLISAATNLIGLAIIAQVGAFLTPVAVSTGQNRQIALMSYLLVVNAGFLLVGVIRRWPILRAIGWLATMLLCAGWYAKHYHPDVMWITLGFLTAYYVLFQIEALFSARRESQQPNDTLPFSLRMHNGVYFAGAYMLAGESQARWMGLFAAALGSIQFLAAWAVNRASPLRLRAATTLWIDGAAMLALAIPLQWDGYWVCVAWGIHAIAVLWAARRVVDPWLLFKAAALYFAATVHFVVFDSKDEHATRALWQSEMMDLRWTFALACFLATSMYGGAAVAVVEAMTDRRRKLVSGLILAGTVLVLSVCSLQMDRYIATIGWMALAVLWLAMTKWIPVAAFVSLAITLITAGKFIGWDLFNAAVEGGWDNLHGIAFNRAVVTGLLLAIHVFTCKRFIARGRAAEWLTVSPRAAGTLLSVCGVLVLWAVGSFEILRCFQNEASIRIRFAEPLLAMQVSLSVYWGLTAMAVLVAGFVRGQPALRYFALAVFSLTVVKVLAVDMAGLRTIYRIVSFMAVGGLLLATSLVYQKRRAMMVAQALSKLSG